jgi:hypothetical protein
LFLSSKGAKLEKNEQSRIFYNYEIMTKSISLYDFGNIIGVTGNGTATNYKKKGLIVMNKDNKTVDVDKSIEALMSGRQHHQDMAQKALDFFKGFLRADIAENIQETFTENKCNVITLQEEPYHVRELSLVEAMRDKAVIETKLKQVQLNEKISKLIDKETILRVFENILIQMKKDLLNLSRSKISLILREKDNPQSAEKILYDAIHEVLHRNSHTVL